MKLTDIIPWEELVALEKEFNERSGLNSCMVDADGIRVSAFRNWANPLCPIIRSENKGLDSICSPVAQMMLRDTPEPEGLRVSTCAAGLVNVFVPVFYGGEYVGLVGGCGLLPEKGGLDAMAVGTATGLSRERIHKLAQGINRLFPSDIEALGNFLRQRLVRMTGGAQ